MLKTALTLAMRSVDTERERALTSLVDSKALEPRCRLDSSSTYQGCARIPTEIRPTAFFLFRQPADSAEVEALNSSRIFSTTPRGRKEDGDESSNSAGAAEEASHTRITFFLFSAISQ